jgi:6-phosphofructokinase 2
MTDVVTLTPNPAIDLSTSFEQIVPRLKLRYSTQERDPGGGGINMARVVKQIRVAMLPRSIRYAAPL